MAASSRAAKNLAQSGGTSIGKLIVGGLTRPLSKRVQLYDSGFKNPTPAPQRNIVDRFVGRVIRGGQTLK